MVVAIPRPFVVVPWASCRMRTSILLGGISKFWGKAEMRRRLIYRVEMVRALREIGAHGVGPAATVNANMQKRIRIWWLWG